MKIFLYHFLPTIFFSCSGPDQTTNTAEDEVEFTASAKRLHDLYVTAGDCEERNSLVDLGIIFYEDGEIFTYQNILEYCSYIQPKKPHETFSQQYLIKPDVGFDFVDMYNTNQEHDKLREVSSRKWEKKSDAWMMTHMQVSRELSGRFNGGQ